ncbi:unnamed protein product [Miscanthus lutarioriparius]|uniref:Uncharacterized protein n=1 Tax=Miscanthus lutarioriparius TaxID=422564 RepID=A0A811Q2U8_9POAL|nr:unnamed protein product [Miscanthus lutarioriparius]
MAANTNTAEMKALFDTFVADLHKQFDGVKDQFDTINNRLTTIEQGGHIDQAAATARAQREHEATTTKLEAEAKKAMEEAARAFLKVKKESATSSAIPEIVDDLEGKLFDNLIKEEPPQVESSTAIFAFMEQARLNAVSMRAAAEAADIIAELIKRMLQHQVVVPILPADSQSSPPHYSQSSVSLCSEQQASSSSLCLQATLPTENSYEGPNTPDSPVQ